MRGRGGEGDKGDKSQLKLKGLALVSNVLDGFRDSLAQQTKGNLIV
jgi:hypothetical protein